ncbi:MAG: hypothetical protein RL254_967 [Planctomycetota bacterium]|jgi:hypothetical protein
MSSPYRTFQFQLTNAKLDVRSSPADVSSSALRWLLNFETGKSGRFSSRRGFTRFLDQVPYNNEDLHDQLLPIQTFYQDITPRPAGADDLRAWPSSLCASTQEIRAQGSEPICHLREIISTNGTRKFIAATRSRIYQLNEPSGNWRLLSDGYSGSAQSTAKTWQSGQVKNLVFFTNDFDKPCVLDMDSDHLRGCAMRATRELTELDIIGCTKAAALCCFKNIVFLGNVELDNGRVENQLIWSDVVRYDDLTQTTPIRFSNASGSIAGDAQLSYGHRILAIVPLGNVLHVYTTRGIWRGSPTGDATAAFAFELLYESDAGDKCLAYPQAIVSTGDAHWYLSREGHIYKIDPFSTTPERMEWLANAGEIIARTIDQQTCDGHVAGYDAQNGEVYFSWVEKSGGDDHDNSDRHLTDYDTGAEQGYAAQRYSKPRRTFCFVPKTEFGSYMDVGFTAFGSFTSDRRLSFRDFMRQEGICSNTDLADMFVKEGMPADLTVTGAPTCLYTHDTVTIDGITVEDYANGTQAEDSLCRMLNNATADDFCQQCNEDQLFVAACATDDCLKTMNVGYAREICTNSKLESGTITAQGYQTFVGTYAAQGYLREFITGPMVIGSDPSVNKMVSYLLVEGESEASVAPPAWMGLQIATAYNAADSLPENGCGPIWSETLLREFKCQLTRTPEQYSAQTLYPAFGLEGAFCRQGRFVYVRVTLGRREGKRVLSGTGGGGSLSNFQLKVRAAGA